MDIDRRTALGLLGLGVLASRLEAAAQHAHTIQTNPQAYRLQFFSEAENALLECLCEMILPADDHSPGAREAKVSYYIDLVAANSSETARADWKARLAAFDRLAADRYGRPFASLEEKQQSALLASVAARERDPKEPAERFFVDVKNATLFGYYTSQVGLLKELGYRGNQVLAEFPGCTHRRGSHS